MDAVGTVDAGGGATDRGADGTARQAARTALARAPAASRPGRRTRPGADRAGRRLPALRGVLQPGRDRADAVADAGLAPADAAVEPVTRGRDDPRQRAGGGTARWEKHTPELQSLMRISYAVFFFKKKKT